MIKATFTKHNDMFTSFEVTGHAEFAEFGNDIVCAGVSSAVQMCANGITDVLYYPAKVVCEQNLISVSLSIDDINSVCEILIACLFLQLTNISESYEGTINIVLSEV